MKFEDQIEQYKLLSKDGTINVYEGIDGYKKPLIKRIEIASSPIRQIINGETVGKFHKKTDPLIMKFISQRVKKGLKFKNMIRQEDRNLKIEVSNPKTLKETRLLPPGFEIEGIIATFGNYTTITSMNESKTFGIIIHDKTITTMFNSWFNTIWEKAEIV